MGGEFIAGADDPILVTGATGFIGPRVVQALLDRGFRNLRCFARPSGDVARLERFTQAGGSGVRVGVIKGNLLSPEDCALAVRDAAVIFHLAAGGSGKSFPDAFMNSVVATRNLLEATLLQKSLRRFVNVSSLAVYTNTAKRSRLLDESCPIETHPELRDDPYCFAKVKQDELVMEYGAKYGVPYVTVRPGFVFGPGRAGIASRVGIDTFGIFLHLGGFNRIPFTYVDNCAEAIALAGLKEGLEGEVFNIVDDDLPSSRRFLHLYKREVRRFPSLYVPHALSYFLCWAWERYARWSEYQMPASFNRRRWHVYWKSTRYTNLKLKAQTGWQPSVRMADGLNRFFASCREGGPDA